MYQLQLEPLIQGPQWPMACRKIPSFKIASASACRIRPKANEGLVDRRNNERGAEKNEYAVKHDEL